MSQIVGLIALGGLVLVSWWGIAVVGFLVRVLLVKPFMIGYRWAGPSADDNATDLPPDVF